MGCMFPLLNGTFVVVSRLLPQNPTPRPLDLLMEELQEV